MYMSTRANLDYWATDNCCLKWSLRTGTIAIGVLSLFWQSMMVMIGVMMIVRCQVDPIIDTLTDINTTTTLLDTTTTDTIINTLATNTTQINTLSANKITINTLSANSITINTLKTPIDVTTVPPSDTTLTRPDTAKATSDTDNANLGVMHQEQGDNSVTSRRLKLTKASPKVTTSTIHANTSNTTQAANPVTVTTTTTTRPVTQSTIPITITTTTPPRTVSPTIDTLSNNLSLDYLTDVSISQLPDVSISQLPDFSISHLPSQRAVRSISLQHESHSTVEEASDSSSNSTNSTIDSSYINTNNFTCPWLPIPERDVLGIDDNQKLLLVAAIFISYSGIYTILSFCVILGGLKASVPLLHGWVTFTGFHNMVILAVLLVPLPFTTLSHLLLTIIHFIFSLYTWSVVKSYQHRLKVEANKPIVPVGAITDYTVDGVDVTEIPVQV